MRRFFKFGTTAYIIAFPFVTALLMSLTVVNDDSYKNSSYYRFARQELSWIIGDPYPQHAIKAGWAKVSILPSGSASTPTNQGRSENPSDSVDTRALILDNGSTRVALITVDLFMMPPVVAQELKKKLPELGFAWKNVYLGTTQAQPSVGNWAQDYMGQRTFSNYNPEWVQQLTETILHAVSEAKQNLASVQIGSNQVALNGQNEGETHEEQPFNPTLQFLKLQKQTGESAVIYAGLSSLMPFTTDSNDGEKSHSTGRFNRQLEEQTRSFSIGLVSSVQVVNVSGDQVHHSRVEKEWVDSLATAVSSLVNRQVLHTDSVIVAQTTTLSQAHSDPQVRISQHWRLKSWLARKLYGDYPAELKAMRIGDMVFVGLPGGVSLDALPEFLELPIAKRYKLVVTSYNGGNVGQIVPDKYYYEKDNPYDIQEINRFGPHTMAFLMEMTQRLAGSL